jgi:phage N-6-adenine-methyltransferase
MQTSARTGPSINKGKSKQDVGTPWEFVRAVEAKWGPMVGDLACTTKNKKAPKGFFFDEGEDALAEDWALRFPTGNLWLNPPFGDIGPWAERCAYHGSRRDGLIFLLTPASIGTDWFAEHVFGNALVLGVRPRLTFEGSVDPYPKDLCLSIFGRATGGFALWRWKP